MNAKKKLKIGNAVKSTKNSEIHLDFLKYTYVYLNSTSVTEIPLWSPEFHVEIREFQIDFLESTSFA